VSAPGCVAVTGASGFIGRHLCDHFRRRGWAVRALLRNTQSYPFREPGIELVACDLPDRIDARGLSGVSALIHAAYMTRFVDLASAERVNDAGTRRILEMGRAAGVAKFLFISSQSAHEHAESYYAKSKFALEKLFGAEDVIFRSGLVIGRDGDGLFHRMCRTLERAKLMPLFGGGHQPIQTVHVADFCAATELALVRGLAGRFTIAHPKALEMREFLAAIARRVRAHPIFLPFPIAPMLLALRVIEALRIPFPVSSENLLGLKCLRADDTTADLARLGVQLQDTAATLDDVLGSEATLRS
jgi:nucleoside-diphosphate-sugar epimerase